MHIFLSELVVQDYNKDGRDDLFCVGLDGRISIAESTVTGKLHKQYNQKFLSNVLNVTKISTHHFFVV